MKKQKKLVLAKETLKNLVDGQLSGPVGGLVADTEDRRCEPSIVSCKPGCDIS